jgi:hypothetical protein
MLWADTMPADSGHADCSLRFMASARQALTAEATLILPGSFDFFAAILCFYDLALIALGRTRRITGI